MPYHSQAELPDQVKEHLPKHAQTIYQKAFNSACEHYDDPKKRRGNDDQETVAHKVAWNAVKQEYEKGRDGNWHPK